MNVSPTTRWFLAYVLLLAQRPIELRPAANDSIVSCRCDIRWQRGVLLVSQMVLISFEVVHPSTDTLLNLLTLVNRR